MKKSDVQTFKNKLPGRIHVQVYKGDEEGEVWAMVSELPHCYTQAGNVIDLPEMITDLVFTCFEVPERVRSKMGEYVPVSRKHLRLEEMLRYLLTIESQTEAGEDVEAIFQRTEVIPA